MSSTPYRIIVEDQDGSERVFHATRKLLVGRSPEADIRIDEEGVSRIHCSIEAGALGPEVKDLGSTNGTYVNGRKIERARLMPGDTIVVGRRPLRVISEEPVALQAGATLILGATTIEHAISAGSAPYPPPRPQGERATRYLDGLYRLLEAINRTPSGPELDRACLQAIMDVLGMDLGVLFLGRSPESGLKPVQIIDRAGAPGYEPSATVISHALKERKAIIASDALSEAERKAQSLITSGATRIFAAPLLGEPEPYGLVYVSSRTSSVAAVQDDFAFFTAACQQLSLAFQNAERRLKLEREHSLLLEAMPQDLLLAGRSKAMQRVRELIAKAAPFDTTVLITGESGTGKELIARGIHQLSARRDWLFVPVNCGAIPATMMESELFGHERGAFTGATQRHVGKIELANGGTLFLDEVAELPLDLQVKLLRVLEDRSFTRIGGNETVRPDVRFLAATHRDLAQLVREGRFREDLLFRLRVFEIEAPPLRNHLDDLDEIAGVVLGRLAQTLRCPKPPIGGDVLGLLRGHSWPGNVRELRNVLERALILGDGREIIAENLSLVARITPSGAARAEEPLGSLKDMEKEHILRVLRAAGWNKTLAAEMLGIGRPTVYEKIKAYGLEDLEGKA